MNVDHDHSTEPPDEARLRELLDTLREDVRAPVEILDSVMREIDKDRVVLGARVARWALRPRMVPISPAFGGLAVAAGAALVVLWPAPRPALEPAVVVDSASGVATRFVLVAPGAESVHLTGDFNSWSREGIALEDLRGTGIWTADVTLPPGVHQYTFVLNGSEWVPDPSAALQVDDGFGQMNSILVIQGEGEA
jgi:hypothetical protein